MDVLRSLDLLEFIDVGVVTPLEGVDATLVNSSDLLFSPGSFFLRIIEERHPISPSGSPVHSALVPPDANRG